MKTATIVKSAQVTKSENATYFALEAMKMGHTKVINGHAVTRWAYNQFEVGTFGRKTQEIDEAARIILQ